MYAVIIPNAENLAKGLEPFTTTVAEVERRTGLDFFAALDDAEEFTLESERRLVP